MGKIITAKRKEGAVEQAETYFALLPGEWKLGK